ncbi:MAG: right-handed parallel beta-helix repeat-containing protein, partial [Planctomycetota bacterium]|nr:right-handed parallel beta-helix repeat-containing protein [Planctomycetota bacterium]
MTNCANNTISSTPGSVVCTISAQTQQSIYLSGCSNNIISGCNIANGPGIWLLNSDNNRITFTANSFITVGTVGVSMTNSSGNKVAGATSAISLRIDAMSERGIYFNNSNENDLFLMHFNGARGIWMLNSAWNGIYFIVNSTLSLDTEGYGISLTNCTNNVISGWTGIVLTITNQSVNSFYLNNCSSNAIWACNIGGGTGVGMLNSSNNGITFTAASIINSGTVGISMTGSTGNSISGTPATLTTALNIVSTGFTDAFYLSSSDNNRFWSCNINTGNTVNAGKDIAMLNSSNNAITIATISYINAGTYYGITMTNSTGNVITSNATTCLLWLYNQSINPLYLTGSNNNVIDAIYIPGGFINRGLPLLNSSGNTIGLRGSGGLNSVINTGEYGVLMTGSSNNIITGTTLAIAGVSSRGMYFDSSNNNLLNNCTLSVLGVGLDSSNGNAITLTGGTINEGSAGITMTNSSNNTFVNFTISGTALCPFGVVVTGTSYGNTIINSTITSTGTNGDIRFAGDAISKTLILRNTTLGGSVEVVTETMTAEGTWVKSQMHDKVPLNPSTTVIWGDYEVAGLEQYNTGIASYPGAADAASRKRIAIGSSKISALGVGDNGRIRVPPGCILEMVGALPTATASTQLGRWGNNNVWDGAGTHRVSIPISGTLSISGTDLVYLAPAGIDIYPGANLVQLNNATFTQGVPGSGGTRYIQLRSGQTITATGCVFDDNNEFDGYVRAYGSSPSRLIFANYVNTNPGSKDNEDPANNSLVRWASRSALTNIWTSIAETSERGEAERPMLRFTLGPTYPVSGEITEEVLFSQITLRRRQDSIDALKTNDDDIFAVRLYRDDGDNVFNPVSDTVVATGKMGPEPPNQAVLSLSPAQPVTATFWVAIDIARIASLSRWIDIALTPTDIVLLSPHSMQPGLPATWTAIATIGNVLYRPDTQIKISDESVYLGEEIYNLTGLEQTR